MTHFIQWQFFLPLLMLFFTEGHKFKHAFSKIQYHPYNSSSLTSHKFPLKKDKYPFYNYTYTAEEIRNLTNINYLSFHADDEVFIDLVFKSPFLVLNKNPDFKGPEDYYFFKKKYWLNTVTKNGLVNMNVGAALITFFFVLFSTIFVMAYRVFTSAYGIPLSFGVPASEEDRPILIKRAFNEDRITRIAAILDSALAKYAVADCSQQVICLLTKKSRRNVANGVAVSAEKIVDGMTSSYWARSMLAGTTLNDAIAVGRISGNCEEEYPACGMKVERFMMPLLENMVQKLS